MKSSAVLASALLLAAASAPAFAQGAAENYSYSAPSGMFSEGTTKWQTYRFMAEDKERTARFNAGIDATGSIQGTAGGTEAYRRPGERGTRRPTSR